MTRLQKEIVGRSAIGVLGLALLLGGWKTFSTGLEISKDNRERAARLASARDSELGFRPRRSPGGSGLFFALGSLLMVGGAVGVLAAVLPTNTFARLIGPPSYTTLGEHGEDVARRF